MTITRHVLVYATLYALSVRSVSSQCEAECTITRVAEEIQWSPKTITETFTAMTVVEIVNTDLGTTRTETIFNEEVALPTNTNSDGTVTTVVTYTYAGEESVTELAFPTSFYIWPGEYSWSGTLPTTDARGSSTCMTAEDAVTFTFDYWEQPATITMPPAPDGVDDSRGWAFEAVRLPFATGEYKSGPSNEAAWDDCVPVAVGPLAPAYGAAYVVQTSRSIESGLTTPTSPTTRRTTSGAAKTAEDAGPTTMTVVSEGPSGATTMTIVSQAQGASAATQTSSKASATANSASTPAATQFRMLVAGVGVGWLGSYFAT